MAKICVITGGTSGIGKCTAEAMAQKGYTVYELSRRAEGLPGMFHIPTDVTDPDACQRAIDEVVSQAGRIDMMINNAGFGISGAIEFTPVEQAKIQILRVMFAAEHTDHALLVVLQELSRHARERDIIVRLCHLAPPLTCRSHSPKQSLP